MHLQEPSGENFVLLSVIVILLATGTPYRDESFSHNEDFFTISPIHPRDHSAKPSQPSCGCCPSPKLYICSQGRASWSCKPYVQASSGCSVQLSDLLVRSSSTSFSKLLFWAVDSLGGLSCVCMFVHIQSAIQHQRRFATSHASALQFLSGSLCPVPTNIERTRRYPVL